MKSKMGILSDTLSSIGRNDIVIDEAMDKISGMGRLSRESILVEDINAYVSDISPEKYSDTYSEMCTDKDIMDIDTMMSKHRHNKIFDIKFDNTSFRYSEDSDYILENVTYEFKGGNVHGILSPSGYGKTTFMNLIVGLLKPTSGRILVNDIDINSEQFDMNEMIDHTAYITQHTHLFMDSILSNILVGNMNMLKRVVAYMDDNTISRQNGIRYILYKVFDCIYHSSAMDFISDQDRGLNTLIGDRVGG